jgi:hypothetical protein
MATLSQIEQLLLKIPGLATPGGFEILPQLAGGHRPAGPDGTPLAGGVIRYNIGLTMFYPSRAQSEGRTCISVIVNDDAPPAKHRDPSGRPLYIQTEIAKPLPYATEVWGQLLSDPKERSFVDVLMTAGGVRPWSPVTREAFINALIVDAEGKDGEKSAELQKTFSKTPNEEWVESAAQRKRDRDETLAQARTVQSAAEVEKLRKQLEDSEREVTERLKKDNDAVRERFAAARTMVTKWGDDLRAALAAMSPAERQMPALINNALTSGPLVAGYRLTSDTASPTWHVRTPDFAFWRFRRSPIEVRSIRVSIGLSGTCLQPAIREALLSAYQQLDWAALSRLLAAS